MNNTTIKAEKRETMSRGELQRIRREGRVPAVIYGEGVKEPTAISIDSKDLQMVLKSNPHAVMELEVPGIGKNHVLISEVQRDTMSREVLHVDFHKINMNQSIRVPVRLEITGTSPGEKEGGMLQLILHEIEVECLPKNLPESILVDVGQLMVGEKLTVADLAIPDNVKVALDPETVVAAVLAPQKEDTEDEPEAKGDETEENNKQAESPKAAE